ncbi:hypothetical protein [Novosphingobium sp. EMRT-2]|uniref:hypothetical protein n=1 Tax=Novosphingobium sp. EMRT-2 TaxID=2571749 RepID=UPI0010BD3E6D|nr:hypothetical protein [Novosphingobium sp. EMRT-2]QCI95198.1 hypothetical protein FA702_01325 [Novosphingobium sp. EMRT-2]
MTISAPAEPSARLYSQTDHDERGNFHYQGDLYCPADDLPVLCRRIERHLASQFPEVRFAIRSERFSGGRKIIAEVLDAPDDLTTREAQEAFIARVRDQIERFGYARSNFYQDFMAVSFYNEVRIVPAYWAALAARRGPANPVDNLVSLASFKKRLKPGDSLTLLHAPYKHRALGTARKVIQIRSKDFVFEGRSYCDFPRASSFACDGRLVRIAVGNEHEPDAHVLYEWLPAAA